MIHGADTETHMGYCRLICIENWFHHYQEEIGDWQKFVDYLLNGPDQLAFFNLRFDVEAILKHFPEEIIKNLLYLTETEIQFPDRVLTFKLIPWKMFIIREMKFEKNRRRTVRKVECFDTAQFYQKSLNEASKLMLGESKTEDQAFAQSLNETVEPWQTQLKRIIQYCQDDAIKSGKLIRKFTEAASAQPINLSPKNPISCAWYAKELIKQVIPETKKIKSIRTGQGHYYSRPWKRWDNVGAQCYFGGRFETPMKGTVQDVYNADINSAYPYWISQLPNPYNLIFVKDFQPEGEFSMVKAEVWVPDDLPIGPLPFRTPESIIFPTGNWTAWFHWGELKNAEKYGVEFQVQKALNGYEPEGPQRPFATRIPEFYTKRAQWKNEQDPRELTSKVAMNSVYGVFYEKNERITETSKSHATEIDGHLLKKQKDNPGRFCFPFLAGWITSQTRVQLLNASIPEETIFYATDGILSRKPLNIPISKKLGEWSLKEVESATVYGNGIYELDGKIKSRGFRKDHARDPRPMKDRMFSCNPGHLCKSCTESHAIQGCGNIFVEVTEKGPIHLNQSFRLRDYSLKDALTWITKEKEMNITKCHKRIWPEFTMEDLYAREINSQPRNVGSVKFNRNPGLVWKGDSGNHLGIANRFLLGKVQVAGN